jgi:hypothetical protein
MNPEATHVRMFGMGPQLAISTPCPPYVSSFGWSIQILPGNRLVALGAAHDGYLTEKNVVYESPYDCTIKAGVEVCWHVLAISLVRNSFAGGRHRRWQLEATYYTSRSRRWYE